MSERHQKEKEARKIPEKIVGKISVKENIRKTEKTEKMSEGKC